jgi:hypothetical protein
MGQGQFLQCRKYFGLTDKINHCKISEFSLMCFLKKNSLAGDVYIRKLKSSQNKDLSFHFKKLESCGPVITVFRKLSLEDH